MKTKKIIMLATECQSTHMVFQALHQQFGMHKVLIEEKESKSIMIKRRAKKLGWLKVLGQLAFMIGIAKPLNWWSKKRVNEIVTQSGYSDEKLPIEVIKHVTSVNNKQTIAYLKKEQPDLIIVNGTRIISSRVLKSVQCPFINMHVGITPWYRGVHGGYWALANNQKDKMGVTIHFVNDGIDTGNIIAQALTHATGKDNFITYPVLQTVAGIKILIQAVEAYFNNELKETKENEAQGNLWYHPTIGQYVYNRIMKGVK